MKTAKHILNIAAFILVAASLATGCAKERLVKKAKSGETYKVTLAVGSADTRTTITQSTTENKLPVVWKSGDKVIVAGETDGYLGTLTLSKIDESDAHKATFEGELKNMAAAEQYLHVYYIGDTTVTSFTEDKFTFDISSQNGTLENIAKRGHLAHVKTADKYAPGNQTITVGTMENMNAVILFDLSAWTSTGVTITGTYNKAVLDLKTGTFDKTKGNIALAAADCAAKTYVTFVPDTTALTFKSGSYSTPTANTSMIAGKFYSRNGDAIRIARLEAGNDGLLPGKFSVAPAVQVQFAKGNLQYLGSGVDGNSSPVWRFADNQYDILGGGPSNATTANRGNVNISGYTADGTGEKGYNNAEANTGAARDLFGWGTSGQNHGAASYQPWSTNTTAANYYAYGNSANNLYDNDGTADWGYNAIVNGGNTTGCWNTLKGDEFKYLLLTRSTTTNLATTNARYSKVVVNGVKGLLIYPDEFTWDATKMGTAPASTNINTTSANYPNTYTAEQFKEMEDEGAVFLPASGAREGSGYHNIGTKGNYWASTVVSESGTDYLNFASNDFSVGTGGRYLGRAIRLVKYVNDLGGYTEDGWGYGPGIEINGVIWAPVNCGVGRKYAYPNGKYYQWGRKYGQKGDPSSTTNISTKQDIAEGSKIENSNKFYYGNNCWYNNPSTSDVWNAEYDPCPTGWRIPTSAEMESLMFTSGTTKRGNWDSTRKGWDFGNGLFFWAGGRRGAISDTDFDDVNSVVFYWLKESYSSDSEYCMAFWVIDSGSTYQLEEVRKASGHLVRCVYDATTSTVTANSFTDRVSW